MGFEFTKSSIFPSGYKGYRNFEYECFFYFTDTRYDFANDL